MATEAKPTGERVQTWLSPRFARSPSRSGGRSKRRRPAPGRPRRRGRSRSSPSTSDDACDVSNYLRRRRPRIDPLAWGRFRVRVRGVLPWKRLFASLSRSRNLSAAVLLLSLFIVDPFDATREAPRGQEKGPPARTQGAC